jgi:hypothetical protein
MRDGGYTHFNLYDCRGATSEEGNYTASDNKTCWDLSKLMGATGSWQLRLRLQGASSHGLRTRWDLFAKCNRGYRCEQLSSVSFHEVPHTEETLCQLSCQIASWRIHSPL